MTEEVWGRKRLRVWSEKKNLVLITCYVNTEARVFETKIMEQCMPVYQVIILRWKTCILARPRVFKCGMGIYYYIT
jgi:hypothetical protein